MKKTYALMLLSLLLIVSCKKDADPQLTIDQNLITVQRDITMQLTADAPCTWSTLDSNVAIVSTTGLVTGVRIGDTKIIAKSKSGNLTAECRVITTPRSMLYLEPYYTQHALYSVIKSKETRVLQVSSFSSLIYYGENLNVRNVMYIFENEKLTTADVMLSNSTTTISDAVDYLFERYVYWGMIEMGVYAFVDGKGTVRVINVDDTLGLNVLYYTDSDFKSSNIYSNYLEAKQRFK